jgi:hypothetical protein
MVTRSAIRLPLALLLALQVILLLIGAGVAARDASGPETPPPPQIDPATLPLTVESGLVAAEARAKVWRPNAELMAVSMQVDWPLAVDPNAPTDVAPGGWITYTFATSADDRAATPTIDVDATLSLLYERRSGALMSVEDVPWSGSTTVTPFTGLPYPVSSSTAVTALELKQGRDWRTACPDVRHVSHVSLARNDAGIWWVVSYGDTRTGVAALQGRVNVQSGQLEDILDRSKPCDQSS